MAKQDWFGIWFDDKKEMIATMYKNLASDLEAGYSPTGHSVRKQRVDIEEYIAKFDRELDHLKTLDEAKTQHWCYIDLLKRGVISR